MRRLLAERGFVEVETPVLHVQAGGAAARPFFTHHNALDMPLVLRIALELHLKRLLVGGIERVFEIGRVFRNEGLSTRHNPEFTMLECYQAFADYTDMMTLTEELVAELRRRRDRSAPRSTVDGVAVDLAPPWPRRTMLDLIARARRRATCTRRCRSRSSSAVCDASGSPREPGWGSGKLVLELYEKTVEPQLVGPVFVCDYPREVSPLARDAPRRSRAGRALRGRRPRARAGERVQRAQRPDRPARAVRGPGEAGGGR